MIDRRELLHRTALVLGGALSASAVAGILGGCSTGPETAADTKKPAFFTASEAATVSILAEQILPRTDTPGAIKARLAEDAARQAKLELLSSQKLFP